MEHRLFGGTERLRPGMKTPHHTIIPENVRIELFIHGCWLQPLEKSSNPGLICNPTDLTVLLRESVHSGMSKEKEKSESQVLVSPCVHTGLTEQAGQHSP